MEERYREKIRNREMIDEWRRMEMEDR